MKEKKFLGKIRQDPLEALSKGPKEVMASLWQEYLEEILNANKKSKRYQKVKREIENVPGVGQHGRGGPGRGLETPH